MRHETAPVFVGAGAAFVVPGFVLADSVPLSEMVRQVRAAVVWIHRNIGRFGAIPERLYLTGYSSGAHIAAMVMAGGWRADAGVPEGLVKGAVLTSGSYDLEPVRLGARNEYLHLTAEDAVAFSPASHLPQTGPPLVGAWGDGELAEFQRQGRAFAEAWAAAGHPDEILVLPGHNHFDACGAFEDRNGPWPAVHLPRPGLGGAARQSPPLC